MSTDVKSIAEEVRREGEFLDRLFAELGRVIVGQRDVVQRMLIGLLCGGHVLIEGVPGLAKTTAVKSLAAALDVRFRRIQFTPDLLPADLIGTLVYNPRTGDFTTRRGPVFANIVLADEINRAPAKVQSALLEAMQEHQVTIGDETHVLEEPFLVMATQNPIEQEGTYPLPEAQVDRFMLKVKIGYPTKAEERQIMERVAETGLPEIKPVASKEDLFRARETMRNIYMDDKVKDYIVEIVAATRDPEEHGLKMASLIAYGASPRASIYLNQTARAHAFCERRGYVTPHDVKSVGMDVLRHRLILTYEAEAEEMTTEDIIRKVFDAVKVP